MRPYSLTVARREVAGPVPYLVRDTYHAEVVDEAGAAGVANAARGQADDLGGVAGQLAHTSRVPGPPRRLQVGVVAEGCQRSVQLGVIERRRESRIGGDHFVPARAPVVDEQVRVVVTEAIHEIRIQHSAAALACDRTAADGPPRRSYTSTRSANMQHADSRRDRLAFETPRYTLAVPPFEELPERAGHAIVESDSNRHVGGRVAVGDERLLHRLCRQYFRQQCEPPQRCRPAPALRIMKASSGSPDGSAL